MATQHSRYYPEVDASLSLPSIEKDILHYWKNIIFLLNLLIGMLLNLEKKQ
ncbi:isoleucyl-tRNA synthetase domain protein [Orientia tsutsugamushi str. TA763]|nr:isoleucyl-tRNA synthetase domain protein [Orientia tsutsugamushi str. TA763]